MEKPLWMWSLFIALVLILLALDLGLFSKNSKNDLKHSIKMSIFYIIIALLFSLWIYWQMGIDSTKEYLTGYIIEKTLSLDNIFLISLVFNYFAIPLKYQHRVLFWGIVGVIVLRALMISAGAVLVSKFSWIMYLFSVFLIFTGIKICFTNNKSYDLNKNIVINFIKNNFRVTEDLHGNNFWIKKYCRKTKEYHLWITPLFLSLIIIELIDLIFAIDSVPAIFSITSDPYIIYTSNIFAILGLRALYFALADIIEKFAYLKYSLALVLVFIGSKIFIADYLELEKFPAGISLSITVGLIASGVLYSMYKTSRIKNAD